MIVAMRSQPHLDPARSIIADFGGVDAVASITKRHPSWVYRWMYPTDAGGTGGRIPHDEAAKLLRAAREKGLDITADRFFGEVAA